MQDLYITAPTFTLWSWEQAGRYTDCVCVCVCVCVQILMNPSCRCRRHSLPSEDSLIHLVFAGLQAMQLFAFCSSVKEQVQGEQQEISDRLEQLAGIVSQFQGQMQGLQSYLGVQAPSASHQYNQLGHHNAQ